jgi:O-antigen/teichoic acid export membrane protein
MFGELTRKVGAVAVGRLGTSLAAVGTNILLAWLLTSKAENGLAQKVFIVAQIAVLAGAFGIQTSLYYFLPRLPDARRRGFILQSTALMAAIGLGLAAVVWVGAPTLAYWMRGTPGEPATDLTRLTQLLRFGALTIALGIPAMVADPVFIALDRAWFAAGNTLAGMALQLGLIAVALGTGMPLQWIFIAIAASAAIRLTASLAFTFFGVPRSTPGGEKQGALLLQQLTYVLPVGMTSLVDTISSWLDRTLISHYFDAAQLATYTYGAVEIPFISIVIGSVAPVLLSRFSSDLKEGNYRAVLEIWHRATSKGAVILFGLFFMFLWIAPEFIAAVYSSKYRDSALYFRIYLALLPVRIVAFMPILYAMGRNTYVLVGTAIEVLLNLALSIILIHQIGMAGAAVGTVLSTLWQAWFYLSGIRLGMRTTWRSLLPWPELLRDFVKAAAFFLPLALLKVLDLPDTVDVVAAGLAYALYAWYRVLPRLRA